MSAGLDAAAWARLDAEARRRARPDPAHDHGHVRRVVALARRLARAAGADEDVARAAALLHELFSYPKGHPESSRSGDVCAVEAEALLLREGHDVRFAARVAAAIRDHAFSKGVVPEALEARVLQDADRLDALGAVGLARMWATCSSMGRPFFADADPFCDARAPDDGAFGVDHVYRKLLKLPALLHTDEARRLAEPRVRAIHAHLAALRDELAEAIDAPDVADAPER